MCERESVPASNKDSVEVTMSDNHDVAATFTLFEPQPVIFANLRVLSEESSLARPCPGSAHLADHSIDAEAHFLHALATGAAAAVSLTRVPLDAKIALTRPSRYPSLGFCL